MHCLKTIAWWLCCVSCTVACVCADEPLRLAHRWEVEPDLGAVWLPPRTAPSVTLDPQHFASEQLQYVLDEAHLAQRYANQENLSGGAAALEAILERLKTMPDNRQVSLALAGAAIALSDASHAPVLWERLNKQPITRPLIERELVRWKSPLALDSWRARLLEPAATQADLTLAIQGVGAVGGPQDSPALEALLRADRLPAPIKIVVAQALGAVVASDLESLASDVLAANIDHRELLAAHLLANHTSPAARQHLLTVLASQHQPARTVAYAAISRNYAELAHELAGDMLAQADNNLRAQAVAVLDQYDDADSLRLQAKSIADQNYKLRVAVRQNLERKAQLASLKPIVDEIIDEQLNSDAYQGIEQAILLSVALREAERCPTYLKLLEYPRLETSLIAAWALQELAQTPELMDGILAHVLPLTQRLVDKEHTEFPEHLRQAFLFEAMGRNAYQPAVETLKLYIPKQHFMGDLCRASAIWALGKILEDSQDANVAGLLADRMLDESIVDPEDPLVKYNSTIALGWIKAPGSLEKVGSLQAGSRSALGLAVEWSKLQLQE